jgi:multidrug efflux pump subunit AcrA (membrane-fusion protein)
LRRSSAFWFLPPVALGIAIAAIFISQAEGPAGVEDPLVGRAVRTVSLQPVDIAPVAMGWGNVQAAETWTAVSEVKGQVIWRHPDLDSGKLIAGGTKVLEIDPTDYQLAIVQAEADLAAYAAEAAQIDAEAENTSRILDLEEARLALSDAELVRNRQLLKQGVAAQTRVDEAERATLLARRSVVELKNTLALIGPRRAALAAQIARTNAALARSQRDLDHTSITTPYDVRVTAVTAERFQYVNIGQTLVAADGVDRVEVVAQLPFAAFLRLLYGTEPIEDTLAAVRDGPSSRMAAEVRVEGALDARARTVPVVVTVEDPYGNSNPPLRPPLLPNMQVELTLTGRIIPGSLVIPEAALHGKLVYVADDQDQLDMRPVTEAFRQNGLVVIAEGLAASDRLILDDITPAIPGIKLLPIEEQP